MTYRSSSRNRSAKTVRPFVAFLFIASFGILFAGCKGPEDVADNQDFIFTQENVDQSHQLAENAIKETTGSGAKSGSGSPYLEPIDASGSVMSDVVLDLSMVSTYNAIRTGEKFSDKDVYSVTNTFLNVRKSTSAKGESIDRLNYGDSVLVLSFPTASWAEVQLANGSQGFVSLKYIAKITTDEKLVSEKKKYEGKYFVHYQFVNVRKEANQKSEKVGEIPGDMIVTPTSIKDGWAQVMANGVSGYVAMSYLTPFSPKFLVRQNEFTVPVLTYHLTSGQEDTVLQALTTHVASLKKSGVRFITFSGFRDRLLAQQKQDTRIDGNSVIVAITGLKADNVKKVSDALNNAGIDATLFIETKNVGFSGITEKMLLTLQANGFDIESSTHTGDDLRALTNAQVSLEMTQSRKLLEEMTHKTISAIAYPAGGTNDRVMQMASDAGYLLGLSTGSSRTFTRDQLLSIPGIDVFPTMTAEDVVKMVMGK